MGSLITKNMEGQIVQINTGSKVLKMELNNRFAFAGKVLKWDKEFGMEGFGINKTILNFIIGSGFKLLIRYNLEPQREYWIDHKSLQKFVKSNPCLNIVKKKSIYNIPCLLFRDKPNFQSLNSNL